MPMIYKVNDAPLNLQSTFIDTVFNPFKYLLSVKCFVHGTLLAQHQRSDQLKAAVVGRNHSNQWCPFRLLRCQVTGKPANKAAFWISSVLFSQLMGCCFISCVAPAPLHWFLVTGRTLQGSHPQSSTESAFYRKTQY